MHLSVVCAEDLPRSQNAPAQSLFAESIAAPYRRLCPDWPKGELSDAYYTIGPSQSPVLLLSGGLDPATPTLHGDRVTRALGAKARHLVVANAGHGLMGLGCASELIFQFLDAPTDAQALKVDAQCLSRIPRPPVFDPGRGAAIQ
jgi:pimeloyl-ACP methyl ester carboxylesterase